MILVVCPNLAIDVTIEVDELRAGDVHRSRRTTRRAGGKGVNVARAAKALGESALVLGVVGGRRGAEIEERLAEENIDAELVAMTGESRTCTIALEPSGRATVLNETGPRVENARELRELEASFDRLLASARAVVLAGSLQPGLAPTLYRDWVGKAVTAGVPSVVDASGAALRAALTAHPTVAKPNVAEAEALLGESVGTHSEWASAARELNAAGAELAIVSRGAEGVVAAGADGIARYWTPPSSDLRYGNPTGAGDALAAGVVVGYVRGFDSREAIRLGVAAATASLAEGYGIFRPKDVRVDAVQFEPLD